MIGPAVSSAMSAAGCCFRLIEISLTESNPIVFIFVLNDRFSEKGSANNGVELKAPAIDVNIGL